MVPNASNIEKHFYAASFILKNDFVCQVLHQEDAKTAGIGQVSGAVGSGKSAGSNPTPSSSTSTLDPVEIHRLHPDENTYVSISFVAMIDGIVDCFGDSNHYISIHIIPESHLSTNAFDEGFYLVDVLRITKNFQLPLTCQLQLELVHSFDFSSNLEVFANQDNKIGRIFKLIGLEQFLP